MTEDCWLWAGYINSHGYGEFHKFGKRFRAHRVSYEQHVGEIPEGLVIDHLCRVRHCINPEHLEPVTASENTLRGEGVLVNTRKTHCPRGHEYNAENTMKFSKSWRRCRTCENERHKRYYRANKEKWLAYNAK